MPKLTTYFVLQWAALALYSTAMLGGASAAHSRNTLAEHKSLQKTTSLYSKDSSSRTPSGYAASALKPPCHDTFNGAFASSPRSADATYQKAMSKWLARWVTVTTKPIGKRHHT